MSGIYNDSIGTCINKRLHTVESVGCNTHTCSYTQTPLAVFASHGLVLGFSDILVCDKSNQFAISIDYGEFFNLILLQNLRSRLHISTLMGGDNILTGHHLINMLVHLAFETEVTIGYDTNQTLLIVNHGNTSNMILSHQSKSILHCRTTFDCDRVVNHTILCTLDNSNLTSLFFDRHILMDNTYTTFAGNGNGHLCLSDGIHSGCHKRYLQIDVT